VTPPGNGAVAVFRVSGKEASLVFKNLAQGELPPPRLASVRWLRKSKSNEKIDRALVIWMPGPESFSGEDVLELHVHGGSAVKIALVKALEDIGNCRLANPGEFSARAFLSGKLDLTEIEGIADLIAAETENQRKQALFQAQGGLSKLYEGWAKRLLSQLAHLEAEIDFSDEPLPQDLNKQIHKELKNISMEMYKHLSDGYRGERLRDGIKIAILGEPNAGKSSLFNILAEKNAAIISEFPGTTRDVLEVKIDIIGMPVILCDTAGIRLPQGKIEAEGIRRSYNEAENCDIKLIVIDGAKWPIIPEKIKSLIDEDSLLIINKSELIKAPRDIKVGIHQGNLISCKELTGIEEIMKKMETILQTKFGRSESAVITRERHRIAVKNCYDAIKRFLKATEIELGAEDLRLAVRSLGRITGKVEVDDILDVVFKDFCIGK
tara:strand:- start:95143 stop:96450 length:1308 start_codon:yes stop_codon:yes gene_type:complete